MASVVVVSSLPKCDICAGNNVDRDARYDVKTHIGPWANLCEEHWPTYRASSQLGTGFGQRLILEGEE